MIPVVVPAEISKISPVLLNVLEGVTRMGMGPYDSIRLYPEGDFEIKQTKQDGSFYIGGVGAVGTALTIGVPTLSVKDPGRPYMEFAPEFAGPAFGESIGSIGWVNRHAHIPEVQTGYLGNISSVINYEVAYIDVGYSDYSYPYITRDYNHYHDIGGQFSIFVKRYAGHYGVGSSLVPVPAFSIYAWDDYDGGLATGYTGLMANLCVDHLTLGTSSASVLPQYGATTYQAWKNQYNITITRDRLTYNQSGAGVAIIQYADSQNDLDYVNKAASVSSFISDSTQGGYTHAGQALFYISAYPSYPSGGATYFSSSSMAAIYMLVRAGAAGYAFDATPGVNVGATQLDFRIKNYGSANSSVGMTLFGGGPTGPSTSNTTPHLYVYGDFTADGYGIYDLPHQTGTTLQTNVDHFNTQGSTGVADGTLTYITADPGSGTNYVKVAAGEGYLRTTNDQQGALKFIKWSAVTGIEIPAPAAGYETARFIGIEYNSGTPQVTTRTSFNWNWFNDFPLGRVTWDGTTLRILNAYAHAEDVANNARKFNRLTMPFTREEAPEGSGGLEISEVATRQLALSGGNIWHGFNKYVVSAVAAGTAFDTHYRKAGGGFTSTAGVTQWPNTEYDDGSGTLATMTVNRYAVLWVYVDVSDGELDVIYGRAQYTSVANAQAEGVPTTPAHLQYHGRLVARLIFQKSAAAASLIESAWADTFKAGSGGSGITGTGAADRVAFWDAASTQTYDDDLVWDNTSKRLGLNTTSPQCLLEATGSVRLGAGSSISFPADTPEVYIGASANAIINATCLSPSTDGAQFIMRAQGSGGGGNGQMASGDWISLWGFRGHDGSAFSSSSDFTIVVAAAEAFSGATNHGTRLTFAGIPVGSGTKGDWVTLKNARLGIGTTDPTASLDIFGKFLVDSNGDLTRINDAPLTWPGMNVAGWMRNDGAGALSWEDIPTMIGATGVSEGVGGLVPQPIGGDDTKFLRGDATWATVAQVTKETPTGTVNGTNVTFGVSISLGAKDMVFTDGLLDGDATEVGGVLTTSSAPVSSIYVWHIS